MARMQFATHAQACKMASQTTGRILNIKHLAEVLKLVNRARAEWRGIGIMLGLGADVLEEITAKYSGPGECLDRVLRKWLRKQGEVRPSWFSLQEALRTDVVGRQDIADDIQKHLDSKKTSDGVQTEPTAKSGSTPAGSPSSTPAKSPRSTPTKSPSSTPVREPPGSTPAKKLPGLSPAGPGQGRRRCACRCWMAQISCSTLAMVCVSLVAVVTKKHFFPTVIDCGSLANPPHGQVLLTETTHNATATYSCNTGYVGVGGATTRVCQSDGNWTSSPLICQLVDCGNLAEIANGVISYSSGTTYSSVATYSCVTGHKLRGEMIRTCQANGLWDGSEPSCIIEDCGTLPAIKNGVIGYSSGTTYSSVATYSCVTGYKLQGGMTRTCQADGMWDGRQPSCTIVDCRRLTPIVHGSISYSGGTIHNSVATYSCDTGYELQGGKKRTCQSDGSWSGSTPTCQIVDCGELEAPANGRIHVTATTYGSSATYTCVWGCILIGGTYVRLCQANRRWSGSMPICGNVIVGVILVGSVLLILTSIVVVAVCFCYGKPGMHAKRERETGEISSGAHTEDTGTAANTLHNDD